MIWTNLVLALSHAAVIPAFRQFGRLQRAGKGSPARLTIFLLFISLAYHLGDTRYGQSGIWPFQSYGYGAGWLAIYELTMIASITAFFLFFYRRMEKSILFYSIVGIASWQMANYVASQGYMACFVLFHSYWNVVVFDCLNWSLSFVR